MDKYILNAGELQQLKEYIYRHGFREQTTMVEILDHFACKVEELKTANPQLPFEMAMDKAHKSFGVAGFYPLVKAYELTLEKKYKKIFWANVKKIIFHPIHAALLIFMGIAVSKAYVAADTNGWMVHRFGLNDVHALCYVFFLISGIILNFGMFKPTAENPIIKSAHAVGNGWWLLAYVCLPLAPEPHKHVLTLAIMAGIATVSFSILTIARYRTVRTAMAAYYEIMEIA